MPTLFRRLLVFAVAILAGQAWSKAADRPVPAIDPALAQINNVIVIYQENWSFDGLYGSFPGADGLRDVDLGRTHQVDEEGRHYKTLPSAGNPDLPGLPNQPFDLAPLLGPERHSRDLVHRFYTEQAQIHGGTMDRFVLFSDAKGLAMSHYDASDMPEGRLAKAYTLCDRFFHAAFGGSYLNHQWLIAAGTPPLSGPLLDGKGARIPTPKSALSVDDRRSPKTLKDAALSPDGVYAINTVQSIHPPHPDAPFYLKALTITTIGDLLTAHGATWRWYSGGWNAALADTFTAAADGGGIEFQFHHQPFNYYARFAPGSPERAEHLRDETDFMDELKSGKLPMVSFVKPAGVDNEHPSYATLAQGQQHVQRLVQAIQASPYWRYCLIIITYDEHGGRWDHVAPPGSAAMDPDVAAYTVEDPARADAWGPGERVPTILVSPHVRKGHVDHTIYDTTSILKLIEDRYCAGQRLGSRDAAVHSLAKALVVDDGR